MRLPRVTPDMARYFFDLLNGSGLLRDEEGVELPDDETARAWAIGQLRPILADEVMEGRLNTAARIIVRTEERRPAFEVEFSDAVQIDRSVP